PFLSALPPRRSSDLTTSAGTYLFDAVQPGTYRVTIAMTGFKTYEATGIVVTIGQPANLNATLVIGAATEKVEVQGAADLVQTATDRKSTRLNPSHQI